MPELPKIVISKLVAGNVRPEDLQDAHPDPDLLTAFVEHTLPERERTVLLGHLAQCSPCREIIALAQPGEAEMQVVAGVARPRVRGWFLRWGVLAACAAVAVSAVVLRTNSRRETPLVAKQEAPAPMAESRASAKASSEVNKSASAAPVAGKSPRDEADVQPALGVAKSASAPQEREDVDKKELGEFRTRKVAPTPVSYTHLTLPTILRV